MWAQYQPVCTVYGGLSNHFKQQKHLNPELREVAKAEFEGSLPILKFKLTRLLCRHYNRQPSIDSGALHRERLNF